jgi:DtxR family Mn-dependent transcriptional regulator
MRLEQSNADSIEPAPSEVIARYLEAIYYINSESEPVRSARLADWLGVSRPTVTVALRRMSRDGMVKLGVGKQVELTPRGHQVAETIVRRHRIVERWLTDALGLDWVAADEEAARLEHAVSERVEQRLFEAVGRPSTCPHGNPIPGQGTVQQDEVRLSALKPGQSASVSRISEVAEREAPALLEYLGDVQLHPGRELVVEEVSRGGGTVRVRAGGPDAEAVTMSGDTAGRVWVVPALADG